jgi:hypothetical protein
MFLEKPEEMVGCLRRAAKGEGMRFGCGPGVRTI